MSNSEEVRYQTIIDAEGNTHWSASTRWFVTGGADLDEAQANVRDCLEDHFEKSRQAFEMRDDLIVYRHPASPQARETFRVG